MKRPGVPRADHKRFRALDLHEQGKSLRDIAAELDVSLGALSKWTNDEALRVRWHEHRGEQRARTALAAAIDEPDDGGEPDGQPQQAASSPVLVLATAKGLEGGALPPSLVLALVDAVADGMFECRGDSYDFGFAADAVGIRRDELVALQVAAHRGDEPSWISLRALHRAAAAGIRHARSKLKSGAPEREGLRLWLDQVIEPRNRREDGGGDGSTPLSHLSDEQLDDLTG